MKRAKRAAKGLRFQLICGSVLMLLLLNFLEGAIGYYQFTDSLTAEYTEAALSTARTAAALVDADQLDAYLENGGGTLGYQERLSRMDTLCQTQNVTLIYVIKVDTSDYGRFWSVFNVVNENSDYTPWEIGYQRDTTNEEYAKTYRQLYEGDLKYGSISRTSSLGGKQPHTTVMLPLKGSDGQVKGILCVQRPMTELETGRATYQKRITLATLFIVLLASINIAAFLNSQFVRPLEKISAEAQRFALENKPCAHTSLETLSRIREIRRLGLAIEKMEQDSLAYMDHLTAITAEKERIGTELALATRIQTDMLPTIFPAFPERKEFDIYASMTPAKEVGGDFYDFFLIDDDHLGLVMADVSGKGVPAALFMMMSKMLLNNFAMMGGGPGQVLERTNTAICKHNKSDMFVSVWFGVLTISTGKIVAANAGHEYPILKRADGRFEVVKDPHGLVVGGMEDMTYREYELTLEPGGTLFLYTDGVPEATDGANEMFGMERTLETLNRAPEAAPKEILEQVSAAVRDFVGDAPQFDDLTMMAVKLLDVPGEKT